MQANGDVRGACSDLCRTAERQRQKYVERYFLLFYAKRLGLPLKDKLNLSFGHFRKLGMTKSYTATFSYSYHIIFRLVRINASMNTISCIIA